MKKIYNDILYSMLFHAKKYDMEIYGPQGCNYLYTYNGAFDREVLLHRGELDLQPLFQEIVTFYPPIELISL